MKLIALLVALVVVAIGIVGVIMPDRLVALREYVATPAGLYTVAALRVGIGLVLIFAAAGSRVPRTLRVIGIVVLVAGLVTPLFGVERTRVVLDWEAAQGTSFIRAVAVLPLALGSFLAFAVATGRRPAKA